MTTSRSDRTAAPNVACLRRSPVYRRIGRAVALSGSIAAYVSFNSILAGAAAHPRLSIPLSVDSSCSDGQSRTCQEGASNLVGADGTPANPADSVLHTVRVESSPRGTRKPQLDGRRNSTPQTRYCPCLGRRVP